jgi:histidinol-phosphate/aromatic aminotransferase/cobyric acid decarboxylase-like protein
MRRLPEADAPRRQLAERQNLRRAAEWQEVGLELLGRLGDSVAEAPAANKLALTYERLGDAQRALALHQRTLAAAQRCGSRRNQATAWLYIGQCQQREQRWQEAEEAVSRCLELSAESMKPLARAALGSDVTRGVPRIIFLCRPNNPTGAVFAEAAFRRFLAQVEPETLVVVDQAYHEFDASPFDSLALLRRFPNLILTRTFSKAHGLAALRIGYGIARPEIWAPLLRVREPFSVNGFAQAAALAALEDEAHLAKTLATARAGKAYLASLCRELGIAYVPSEANFLFIDLGRPAQPVYEALLREGVIVRPCGAFGRPTCVRVTAGGEEAMQRFGEALRQALG